MPVGFVGASELKEAAIADGRVPVIAMRGRKGGSAMAAAAINALGERKGMSDGAPLRRRVLDPAIPNS